MKMHRKLLAAMVVGVMASSMVVPSALADTSQPWLDQGKDPTVLLRHFNIVSGYEDGSLRLDREITRAEMVKIIVAAAGLNDLAALLKGSPAFSDTANHWASGYVALAKSRGFAAGYPDGTFKPDQNVKYEEVLAFIMRVAEVNPVGDKYPDNYVAGAKLAGIIPEWMDIDSKIGKNAVRGDVFAIADAAFTNVKIDGKNLYQRVFDSIAPVIELNPVEPQVTAKTVVISGKAHDAAEVKINGYPITTAFGGAFSAEVDLAVGTNEIVVSATDLVGNEAVKTVTVERLNTAIDRIEVNGKLTVAAGETADLPVTVKDTNGEAVPTAQVSATITPEDLGTFENGVFTAGTKAQTGTITLTAGDLTATVDVEVMPGEIKSIELSADKTSVAPGTMVKISVTGLDEYGNKITDLTPTFSVDGNGALIDSQTGTFIASESGVYTVTATVGELTGTLQVGVHASKIASVKVTAPAKAVGNSFGSTKGTAYEVTVAALDKNGVVVGSFDGSNYEFRPTVNYGVTIEPVDDFAKNGAQRFNVYFDAALSGTKIDLEFEAYENGSAVNVDAGEATVDVERQEATALKFKHADKYLVANSSGNVAKVQVVVVDQKGVEMVYSDIYELTATLSGPAVFVNDEQKLEDILAYPDAEILIYSEAGRTGTVTLKVNGGDLGTISTTLKAAIAGDPKGVNIDVKDGKMSAVVADDFTAEDKIVTLTVTSVDKAGVPVATRDDLPIKVSMDVKKEDAQKIHFRVDGSEVTPAANEVTDILLGVLEDGATTVDIDVVSELAGPVTLTFKVGDYSPVKKTFTFTAGSATRIEVKDAGTETLPILLPASDPEVTFTAQLVDEFGNPVAKAGVELTVTGLDDSGNSTNEVTINGSTRSIDLLTDAAGRVTFTVKTRPYAGTDYGFRVAGGSYTSARGYLSVVNAVPESVKVDLKAWDEDQGKLGASLGSPAAGTKAKAVVIVKDRYGGEFGGAALDKDYFTIEINGEPTTIGIEWDNNEKAWLSDVITLTKAGTNTVEVKVTAGKKPVIGRDTVNVVAGNASKVSIAQADESGKVKITEDKITSLSVRATDAHGNIRSFSSTKDLTVKILKGVVESYDIEVRLSASGIDIVGDPDALQIKSSTTIYVIGKNTGTYTIQFFDGAEKIGENTIEVVE